MLEKIMYFMSFLYPLKVLDYLKILNRYLFSAKVKRKFATCGKNFKIDKPSYFRGEQYASIGDDFWADAFLFLQCWDDYKGFKYSPSVSIGDKVHLGLGCHIGCINKVVIGNNVLMGKNVHITDHNHGTITAEEMSVAPINRELFSKGEVIIEDNVWIGDNVVILPGVKLGQGCIIGANAVVSRDVPKNCVAAGIPAVPKKYIK